MSSHSDGQLSTARTGMQVDGRMSVTAGDEKFGDRDLIFCI